MLLKLCIGYVATGETLAAPTPIRSSQLVRTVSFCVPDAIPARRAIPVPG